MYYLHKCVLCELKQYVHMYSSCFLVNSALHGLHTKQ